MVLGNILIMLALLNLNNTIYWFHSRYSYMEHIYFKSCLVVLLLAFLCFLLVSILLYINYEAHSF